MAFEKKQKRDAKKREDEAEEAKKPKASDYIKMTTKEL